MKSIFLTIAFVFGALALSAQSDQHVKVIIKKTQFDYLTTNIVNLEKSVAKVQDAYQRSDDYVIGKTKGDIVKTANQAPSVLGNINTMILATKTNPDAIGIKNQLNYETYVDQVNQSGDYVEIQLLPSEVDALNLLVRSVKRKKTALKNAKYAIHQSQKDKGSEKNVALLAEMSTEMNEALEILTIGKHR